jgi:LysM repeat protein
VDNLKCFINYRSEGLYIVEKGDTLNSIALKFNTTKNMLILDNHLTEEVKEKDYLYIRRYKTVYSVEACDTLDSLANKFNMTKEEILRINRINYIYPTLKIIIE